MLHFIMIFAFVDVLIQRAIRYMELEHINDFYDISCFKAWYSAIAKF